MASLDKQPQKPSRPTTDRLSTGSMLFPDVVWAHWTWQRRIRRPSAFGPRRRRAFEPRRLASRLARAARANARPTRSETDGAATATRADIAKLENEYRGAAREFQYAEGTIVRAYWCATEASAVVLTEKKKKLSWLPWRRLGDLELHRVTDWVTADAPAIAELLHSSDTLAIRINRVLTAVPRRIAMEWIFGEQSYLLGLVERTGGRPTRKITASTIARHRVELDRLERYYDRAAQKAARIRYFSGMLLGLGFVAALGALIPLIIEPFGDVDLGSTSMRTFYACFGAGAVGAMVSVMTRMRQEGGVTLDYEVGPALIVMLGAFRPVLGTIFGVMAYFAIDSKLLPITPPSTDATFFYYALFAFIAGFSERFAHVILGSADLTVAKALTPEPVQPREGAAGAALTTSNGRRDSQAARSDAQSNVSEKLEH